MHETFMVQSDGDMQFLAGQVHEYQVPRLQLGTSHRLAEVELIQRGAGHANPGTGGSVDDQAAAIKSTGR